MCQIIAICAARSNNTIHIFSFVFKRFKCYSKSMLVSPHVTAGVVLGTIIGNPIVVVPVALLSHFVLDSVPHWQETLAPYKPTWKTYVRIPIDLAIALLVVLLAIWQQPHDALAIWLGAIFASAPDLDVMVVAFPQLKHGVVEKFWNWHCAIQRETASLWGLAPQFAVLIVGIVVIYRV